MNVDTINKARTAAGLYTETKSNALCDVVAKRRSPFSYVHVSTTLRLSKDQRDMLVKEAIRDSLTVVMLKERVQQMILPGFSGRQPRKPASEGAALAALKRLCLKWVRWAKAEVADPMLPDVFRGQVNRGITVLSKLQVQAEECLAQIRLNPSLK